MSAVKQAAATDSEASSHPRPETGEQVGQWKQSWLRRMFPGSQSGTGVTPGAQSNPANVLCYDTLFIEFSLGLSGLIRCQSAHGDALLGSVYVHVFSAND